MLRLSRAVASTGTGPLWHPGLVPTGTRSGPDPEHPARTDGWTGPFTRSPGSVRPQMPLTVYCPSFGVSSSSRSCCLRAWKSSSERQRQLGAVGGCSSFHTGTPATTPGPGPSGEDAQPHPQGRDSLTQTDNPQRPGHGDSARTHLRTLEGGFGPRGHFCHAVALEPAPGWSEVAQNPLPRPTSVQIWLMTDLAGLCPDPELHIPQSCTARLRVPETPQERSHLRSPWQSARSQESHVGPGVSPLHGYPCPSTAPTGTHSSRTMA